MFSAIHQMFAHLVPFFKLNVSYNNIQFNHHYWQHWRHLCSLSLHFL